MEFDVIVIGGGHAGIEASFAAARMGAKTLLITTLIDQIGAASCNPAIGGLAKGHLVKEVDALGGAMGVLTDVAGIQFRVLNESKGAAVRGSRAQIDMDLYRVAARTLLLTTPNLQVTQEMTSEIFTQNGAVCGVKTQLGNYYKTRKLIITTGTFLDATIHIGEVQLKAGRVGEFGAKNLSTSLANLGLEMSRLKTGTCPRVLGESLDFSAFEMQPSDEFATPFSFRHKRAAKKQNTTQPPQNEEFSREFWLARLGGQKGLSNSNLTTFWRKFPRNFNQNGEFEPKELPCFIAYTNAVTHEKIASNFHRAPLFTGQINATGPRYCPSIEDKINRFATRERHHLFIEPQTAQANEFYINGFSTSLPYEVQLDALRSVRGFENAVITRHGYAIEYDFVLPTQLRHTLETRAVGGLYLAGQINGTTGYEEAAAQGFAAGANAALSLGFGDNALGGELVLSRDEAYLGVLVDDLVTKGTREPYRMFTSRAEFRLMLREENAILRLGRKGFWLGLLSGEESAQIEALKAAQSRAIAILQSEFATSGREFSEFLASLGEESVNSKTELIKIVARSTFSVQKLADFGGIFDICAKKCAERDGEFSEFKKFWQSLTPTQLGLILTEAKYSHYVKQQVEDVAKLHQLLEVQIPENFDFRQVGGLSAEVVEKLEKFRPQTLAAAANISGITPAAIDILHIMIKRLQK